MVPRLGAATALEAAAADGSAASETRRTRTTEPSASARGGVKGANVSTKEERTKDTGKYANRAYVENYPPLHEWLKKHEARCNWQAPIAGESKKDAQAYVESWTIGRGEVIVVVRANQTGWNVYTPILGSGIEESLTDAEARLGLA